MRNKVGSVFFILLLAAIISAINNIILARLLPKDEMGVYSLVITLVGLITVIAVWGQGDAFVRFFSNNNPSEYNWKRTYFNTIGISALLLIFSVLVAKEIYLLEKYVLLVIALAALFLISTELLSTMVRARKKYNIAIITQRGFAFLFFFCLIILYVIKMINLTTILFFYLISILFIAIFLFFYVPLKIPKGSSKLPLTMRYDGLLFWGLNISSVTMLSVDKLIIGKSLSYSHLAVYATVTVVMALFDLVSRALGFVFVPHFAGLKSIKLSKYVPQIALLSLIISFFYLFGGKYLVHFLYSGKYDEGIPLISIFVVIGVCKVMYTIPSSIIGGRLEQKALKEFFYVNMINVLLNVVIVYWFVQKWQLTGAAIGTSIIWMLRTSWGYFILYKYMYGSSKLSLKSEISALG